MDEDESKPRKDDHLVEPFYSALGGDVGGLPEAGAQRRGCFGLAVLLLLAGAVFLL